MWGNVEYTMVPLVNSEEVMPVHDEDIPEEENALEQEHKKNSWLKKKANTELIQAVLNSDTEQVQTLLRSGVSPLVRCQQTMCTACHVAAVQGKEDILQLLLEECRRKSLGTAGVTARDREGRQPHHLATAKGHITALRVLLRFELDSLINSTVQIDGNLDEQIREDQLDSFLHDHLEVTNLMPHITEGSTALHVAARNNYFEIVNLLLEKNANPNITDSEDFTPLDVAGMYATTSLDSRQYSRGSSVERTSSVEIVDGGTTTDGETLSPFSFRPEFVFGGKPKRKVFSMLDAEAVSNTMNVVSSLIKGGGHLSKDRSTKKTTPLHKFVEKEDIRAIEDFLSSRNGFNNTEIRTLVNTKDEMGRTPAHLAVERSLAEILEMLLRVDNTVVRTQDNYGRIPLHIAVENEWTKGIDILLEQNTDIDVINNKGETVIHIAAKNNNPIILKTLLETASKTIVNQRDKEGYTALFRAIEDQNEPCAQILLDFCMPRKYLQDGSSLIHVAVKSNAVGVLRLLHEKLKFNTQDFNRPNSSGLTPLHLAVQKNSIDCLEYLINLQHSLVDVQKDVDKGGSILHIAAQTGHHEAMKIILENDFSRSLIRKKDFTNREPLILAAVEGHAECVKLLLKNGANLAEKDCVTEKTALELINYNIPNSHRILDDIFDSFMLKSKGREDSPNFQVSLDYSCLLADVKEDGRQLGVIDAFIKCSDESLRRRLFLHPLTETFLFLKWSRLKGFFRFLIFIHVVHTLGLTGLAITTYVHSLPIYILWPWRTAILAMNGFIFFLEVLHSRAHKSYWMDLETWVKWAVIVTSTMVSVLPSYEWLRVLTAVSVLLAWFQLLFLIARNPRWGLRVLMFFEVAANVFQVLTTFIFLILGFAFAFIILFDGKHPFTNIGATMSKILIMMVELDYNGVYGSEEEDMMNSIGILGRILYLGFVILVVMVLTNLMVGMSVSDVAELEAQGRSKRIAKQASFLVLFEKICEGNLFNLISRDRHAARRGRSVPDCVTVWPNKKSRTEGNPLPKPLLISVHQTVLNRDDQAEVDNMNAKIEKLSEDMKEMFELVISIKSSLSAIQLRNGSIQI